MQRMTACAVLCGLSLASVAGAQESLDLDGVLDAPLPLDAVLELPEAVPVQDQVWNGTTSTDADFPAVVSLHYYQSWNGGAFSFCSGTLIHPRWVLTAAHCLTSLSSPSELHVGFGTNVQSAVRVPFAVENGQVQAYIHPDYNPGAGAGAGYDIGLVKLANRVEGLSPMVVNDEPVVDSWIGRELVHAGYGVTEDDGGGGGRQRYTTLPIVSYQSGFSAGGSGDLIYTYNGTFSPNGSWNWDSTSNVCSGDSGGPTFEVLPSGEREIVAVNAIVVNGCVDGAAGVTRVDLYIDWLASLVPELILAPEDGSDEGFGELPDLLEDLDEPDEAEEDAPALEAPGWADPARPDEAAGYEISGCQTAPGMGGAGLAAAAAALLLWRRRDQA